MDEEIVVDDPVGSGYSSGNLLLESGASDESTISYSEVSTITVDDIDLAQGAFIGFGVVGSSCLMCYGMILIIHLFRRVM